MVSAHCIESLQFEVDFESESHAFEEQSRLTAFAQGRAQQIIGEVFDAHSQAGTVQRFEALTIDLGSVFGSDLEAQWEMRLRERLTEALQDVQSSGHVNKTAINTEATPGSSGPFGEVAYEPLHRSSGSGIANSSSSDAKLETLLHFLSRGHLPWYAPGVRESLANLDPLDALAHDVLRENAAALKAAWRVSPDAKAMVRRAAQQLPVSWLDSLIASELTAVEQHAVHAALTTEDHWTSAVGVLSLSQRREFTLHYLLLQSAPGFSLPAFLSSVLQQRGDYENKSVGSFDRGPGDDADITVRAMQLDPALTALHSRLQGWLQAEFLPSAGVSADDPWLALLQLDRPVAWQVLRQLGRSVQARRRMAVALPPFRLAELMALGLTSEEQQTVHTAMALEGLWGSADKVLSRQQRWEFTLNHLLLQAEAGLSFHAYLDSVVRLRGDRDGQSVESVLRDLDAAWRYVEVTGDEPAIARSQVQAWLLARLRAVPLNAADRFDLAVPASSSTAEPAPRPLPEAPVGPRAPTAAAPSTSDALIDAQASNASQASPKWVKPPVALQRVRLAAALSRGTLEGVEVDWSAALDHDAVWLQGELIQLGRSPAWRHNAAAHWGDVALMQLVSLWLALTDRNFVIAVVHDGPIASLPMSDTVARHAEPMRPPRPSAATASDSPSALATVSTPELATDRVRARWAHALSHVLQMAPNAAFSARAYVDSLNLQEGQATQAPRVRTEAALKVPVLAGARLGSSVAVDDSAAPHTKTVFIPPSASIRLPTASALGAAPSSVPVDAAGMGGRHILADAPSASLPAGDATAAAQLSAARPASPKWAIPDVALQRIRLAAALSRGTLEGVEVDWSAALDHDAVWLQGELIRLGRSPAWRHNAAAQWGDVALMQLVGLWLALTDRNFVIAVVHGGLIASLPMSDTVARHAEPMRPSRSIAATAAEAQPPAMASAMTPGLTTDRIRARWAHTLSYLLQMAPNAVFSARAYVKSLNLQKGQALQARTEVDTAAPARAYVLADAPSTSPPASAAAIAAQVSAARPASPKWVVPQVALQRIRLAAALSRGTLEGVADDWTAALDHDAVWLQGELLHVGRSLAWRQHVAGHWGDVALMQLVGLWLALSDRSLVIAVVHGCPSANASMPLTDAHAQHAGRPRPPLLNAADAVQVNSTARIHERWTRTLSYVLQLGADAAFSARAYEDSLLVLERTERAQEETVPAKSDLAPPVVRVLTPSGLSPVVASAQAVVEARAARRWVLYTMARQRALLVAALTRGSLDGVAAAWMVALDHDAAWLHGVLVQVGRSPAWRQDAAKRWSDDTLMQLMGLWLAPSDRSQVLAFVHGSAAPELTAPHPAFAPAPASTPALPVATTHQVRTRWAHILSYVLQMAPGAGFEWGACTRSVLSQEAAEPHLAPPLPTAFDFSGVNAVDPPVTAGVDSAAAPNRAEVRRMRQRLLDLKGRPRIDPLEPAGAFDAHPAWLSDLQQAAVSDEPDAWANAAHRLAAKLFARLAAALVTPDQQAFMQLLIDAQGAGTPDQQRYQTAHLWGRTLRHLLTLPAGGFDPVGFALALRSNSSTEQATRPTLATTPTTTLTGALAVAEFTPMGALKTLQSALLSGLKAHQIEALPRLSNTVDDVARSSTPQLAHARSRSLWTQLLHDTLDIARHLPGVSVDAFNALLAATGSSQRPPAPVVKELAASPLPPTLACMAIVAIVSELRHDAAAQFIKVVTGSAIGGDLVSFHQQFDRVLDAADPADRHALHGALESPHAADRMASLGTPRQLIRLLSWLRPTEHAAIQYALTLVHTACRQISTPVTADALTRMQWRFVLRELFEEGRPFEPDGFVQRLTQHLIAALKPPDVQRWQAALTAAMASLVGQSELVSSPAVAPRANTEVSTRPALTDPLTDPLTNAEALVDGEAIYIANAGMVLAGPYLERLFSMLGLAQGKAFIDADAAERAVHLLQYLVTGATTTPEPELVLNKILCGLPLNTPVARGITLTEAERSAIDGLLMAMIAHWKIIGSTSSAGLRESFLQREGRITSKDDAWQLQVEPRAFDMLLDQLPWGYSLLKFPWMERRLHVDWR